MAKDVIALPIHHASIFYNAKVGLMKKTEGLRKLFSLKLIFK